MSAKTPAEQQLEFLKKFRDQQRSGKLKPGPEGLAALAVTPTGLQSPKKRRRGHGLPLGRQAWQRLRLEGVKSGRLKWNRALGDWAVELLLNMPPEMAAWSAQTKQELFAKIQEWSAGMGLNSSYPQ